MSKLVGYKSNTSPALKSLASKVNANPLLVDLRDGTWCARGEQLLRPDGSQDAYIYGAKGTAVLYSEALSDNLLADW